MGKGMLAKVMKYELHYLEGCGSFEDMQRELWTLQRKTREILNRTIQLAYHWDFVSREHLEETGEYLDLRKETGYKRLDGYIYDKIKDQCEDMSSANINATVQAAWKKYNKFKKEAYKGEMSLPSYKSNQPLLVNKDCVKLDRHENGCKATLTLFSNKYKESLKQKSSVCFLFRLNDNTQRMIIERILAGEYGCNPRASVT